MPFELLVGLIGAVAAGIAAIAGFGIGSLLTPLLSLHYGMKAAVASVSVPHVIATSLRLWRLRREVDRGVLFGFGLINAGGALAGALAHSRITSHALAIVLAVLLVFAGVAGLTGLTDKIHLNKTTAWVAGGVSGAFGGLVGNQGGIRSAAMLGLGVQGPAFVATATAIALMVDAVRMPVYFATGAGDIRKAWPSVAAATIGVVAGTLAGERILRRIPERIFRQVVSAILVLAGIYLLL